MRTEIIEFRSLYIKSHSRTYLIRIAVGQQLVLSIAHHIELQRLTYHISIEQSCNFIEVKVYFQPIRWIGKCARQHLLAHFLQAAQCNLFTVAAILYVHDDFQNCHTAFIADA